MAPSQVHASALTTACNVPHTRLRPATSSGPPHCRHQHRYQKVIVRCSPSAAAKQEAAITCRRCLRRFLPSENHRQACRHHTALWTGGEMAKALGFVRASDRAEDQLQAVVGKRGLLQFWDCCGAETEDAPGCTLSFHVSWDDQLNEKNGWR